MINILIIEDDRIIREGTAEFLKECGCSVLSAKNGREGLELFQKGLFDLILLDLMMPEPDGFGVLSAIRKESSTPVLVMTALSDEETQIKTFDNLADDYISKPFSLIVLKKRIDALLRRSLGLSDGRNWIYQDARVDFSAFSASFQGKDADLKPKEFLLLKLLLQHKGITLTREQILNRLWAEEEAPFDRVIDVYIKNLRKKLGLECIVTVKGVGYKIDLSSESK